MIIFPVLSCRVSPSPADETGERGDDWTRHIDKSWKEAGWAPFSPTNFGEKEKKGKKENVAATRTPCASLFHQSDRASSITDPPFPLSPPCCACVCDVLVAFGTYNSLIGRRKVGVIWSGPVRFCSVRYHLVSVVRLLLLLLVRHCLSCLPPLSLSLQPQCQILTGLETSSHHTTSHHIITPHHHYHHHLFRRHTSSPV